MLTSPTPQLPGLPWVLGRVSCWISAFVHLGILDECHGYTCILTYCDLFNDLLLVNRKHCNLFDDLQLINRKSLHHLSVVIPLHRHQLVSVHLVDRKSVMPPLHRQVMILLSLLHVQGVVFHLQGIVENVQQALLLHKVKGRKLNSRDCNNTYECEYR